MAGRVGLRIAEMGMGWEMDRGDDRDDRNGRDGRGKNLVGRGLGIGFI